MTDINIQVAPASNINVTLDRGLTGPAGPTGAGGAKGYYGSFYDTETQALANTANAQLITINATAENNGINMVDNSKITFYHQATYSFTFSIQFVNASNNIETATVWLRYNGVDYPFSSSHFDIPAKHGSVNGSLIGTVNFVASSALGGGDYVQLYWAGTSTQLQIKTFAAGTAPVYPIAPSVILTVVQVMYLQQI